MEFQRREFIRTTVLGSIALSGYSLVQCTDKNETKPLHLLDSLTLKNYNQAQEESPQLVANGQGDIWMFALRRLEYPREEEVISCFNFDGKKWSEQQILKNLVGKIETITASCATMGSPIVAWTEIVEGKWIIKATQYIKSAEIHSFENITGNSINPILVSNGPKNHFIAWENLHEGKFSIYISRFENNKWSEPIIIEKNQDSCFSPSIAKSNNGDIYVGYVYTSGFHQNIEMSIIDSGSLKIKKVVPIAIGGGHKDRVNINSYPSLAFDKNDILWISYENNRNSSRMEDGDNYTGDRCCAVVSYKNGQIVASTNNGKWLFTGENDHKPTFIKDLHGNLFLSTYCGGGFTHKNWKYRISWLDPKKGWEKPKVLLTTDIKGLMISPAISFGDENSFWLATIHEQNFENKELSESEISTRSRLTQLNLMQFNVPKLSTENEPIEFIETNQNEFAPNESEIGSLSGHPRIARRTKIIDGEKFTLLYGNLHEHTNSSNCWPAGTDGTLHDDYRFGMYSEGYDFFGMTDHSGSTSEIHWRKNLRMAEFYNESEWFVAIPAIEWSLMSDPALDYIQYGAGHYNVFFESLVDARKFIRNKHEVYCPRTPETSDATKLWSLIKEKDISCVTIPHHTADKVHPLDWNVFDSDLVTTVEIFQCRGNNEYPGCPRERNLSRHTPTSYKHAYINYALKEKKYRMGFVASGDHNSMGIGLAALWVKEVSRQGILEALRNRRTFATTGDKMFIDFTINKVTMGSTASRSKIPELEILTKGQYALEKVEILRNSILIKTFDIIGSKEELILSYFDKDYNSVQGVLYYYIRVTQINKAIAWSSPIWLD